LIARIEKELDGLATNLVGGSAQSFDDYQRTVGRADGLRSVIDLITEVTKHVEERIRR